MSQEDSNTRDEEEIQTLRARVRKVEDYSKEYLKSRVDTLEDENQMLRKELEHLRAELEETKQEIEAFTGPSGGRSPPEKRAADLKHALIRAAEEASNASVNKAGAKKHYRDAWESLAEAGHTDLNKPDVYDAMEDAAEAEGFFLGQKSCDGRKIKAVGVKLDELPAHERGRDSTTDGEEANLQNPQTSAVTEPETN
ncbi:hypothetical protein G9464_20690 [Halostella sp. JP-L12]|uniref:hypothetical protein n=1 Tax=Halostella TaxID=1843185 RepID=UPI000EF8195C|nr:MULTISPECIES: hypothetical protein [Halostella]NHN49990.1 hypothetical protein [Halostella sp. JP-L12]